MRYRFEYTLRFVSNAKVDFWNCSPGIFSVRKPPLLIGGRTALLDAWKWYDESSFSFQLQSVVSWGNLSRDIGAANKQAPRDKEIQLFLPYDAQPYPEAGAGSGIA